MIFCIDCMADGVLSLCAKPSPAAALTACQQAEGGAELASQHLEPTA